jgi:acetylornithine deacetylase
MSAVVEHLLRLVRIPSVSSMSNVPVIDHAEQVLHAAGWSTARHAYVDGAHVEKVNLIAAPAGRDAWARDVDFAFLCHTDTVPYAASWRDAVRPFEEDGFVRGCGACDVKGFLACLLTLAQQLQAEKLADLRIVLTADEEVGCAGAKRLVAEDVLRPRAMVIGEPTSLHPARAGKGYCLAEMKVTGKEAHSAHPEQGASAIQAAAHLLVGLEALQAELRMERNEFFSPDYTTLNVGTIRGGTAKNIIPGECGFVVEWRPVPGVDAERVPAAIRERIRAFKLLNPRVGYSFEVVRQEYGFETPANAPLVAALEKLSGKAATAIPFGSEGSVFGEVCDQIVVFGPGDMQTAHSDRECVEIAQMERAVACLQSLAMGMR